MKDIESVHLVYFSGTGGTALIAESIVNALAKRGIEVSKTELNTADHKDIAADLLIMLYPVYIMTSPKPVDEWIDCSAAVDDLPAAVISVSGGGEIPPNTASRIAVIKKLEHKGYDVYYESMFIMPANVFVSLKDDLAAMILRILPSKTEKAVSDMLSAKRMRAKPFFLDRIFAKLGALEKRSGGSFAKNLKVTDGCTGCSWCKNNCPRNNITIIDGKPVWGGDCVNCFRCIYGCPHKAISVSGFAEKLILKNGFDLQALQERTQYMIELPPVEQVAKGYLFKGIRKYLND